MGHWHKGRAVCRPLRRHAHWCANIRPCLDLFARLGADRQMDRGVWPGPVALPSIEVLDQSGESVEFGACSVPPDQDFSGVGFKMEGEHLLLIVHVHFDLLGGFRVAYGETIANFDFRTIFAACAE